MPEAFIFTEAVDVSSAQQAWTGAAPVPRNEAPSGTRAGSGFAQYLTQDQTQEAPEENKAELGSADNVWAPVLQAPAWTFENPGLDEALQALLNSETVSEALPVEASAQAQAVEIAGAFETIDAASGKIEPYIPAETAASNLNGVLDSKEQKVQNAPAAASPVQASAALKSSATVEAAGAGGKFKLDFSVFDAAFPEGWQALLEEPVSPDVSTGKPASGESEGASKSAKLAATTPMSAPVLPEPAPLRAEAGKNTDSAQTVLSFSENPQAEGSLTGFGVPGHFNGKAQPDAGQHGSTPENSSETQLPRVELGAETHVGRMIFAETALKTQAPNLSNPAPLLTRLTEAQQNMVVTDFVQSALPAFKGKNETLTVELNPPELGRVQLKVETSGNGIQAVLTVQDRSLGEFFQGQSDQLRKSLEEAGIRLGGLSVQIRQQFNQGAQDRLPSARERISPAAGPERAVAVESRKKTQAWGSRGLSQVDMMV